tara:strand:- start:40988 stop:41518 length:531 start_codon:yes stop_codon:yes gene_type:complete
LNNVAPNDKINVIEISIKGFLMNKMRAIIYLLSKESGKVSELKVIRLLYLIDWYSCLWRGSKITSLNWGYRFGLKAYNLEQVLHHIPRQIEINRYGSKVNHYFYNEFIENELTDDDIKVINLVLKDTNKLYFNELESLVFSTYPFNEDTLYSVLNLEEAAFNYKIKNKLIRQGEGL